MLLILLATAVTAPQIDPSPPPIIEVTADDTVIDRSCRIRIPDGLRLVDRNGDGVIHVTKSGITLDFIAGKAEMVGAPDGTLPDQMTGIGIRVDGQRGVTIRGARCHRYKCGILARQADGLVLEGCALAEGFGRRLGSTPDREDGADWLRPHDNDGGEWLEHYGAAICVQSSRGVKVTDCRARRRQNGLILDRVTDSRIYDNDFSFLSGWGIAMWRSSRNLLCRNAVDFCIRGYSHGIYNRGQDSAGFLVFEQCSDNVFASNSATHGGDGYFCFAGREALGETDAGIDTKGRGCNGNVLIDNDFSDAAAHGIEITFSFGNRVWNNTIAGNAICGIWGGYSQRMEISGNRFAHNGEAGYGLERGGVNIEHGAFNRIEQNRFADDACGVHLWWDNDEHLLGQPWAKANHLGSTDNVIAHNRFERTRVGVHLRDTDRTRLDGNEWVDAGKRLDTNREQTPVGDPPPPLTAPSPGTLPGSRQPVGQHPERRGRANIVMGEWLPWNFEDPMVRRATRRGDRHTFDVFAVEQLTTELQGESVRLLDAEPGSPEAQPSLGGPRSVAVGAEPGVHAYVLTLRGRTRDGSAFERVERGTLITARWKITAFPCPADPRENPEAWVEASRGKDARTVEADSVMLRYGGGGPSNVLDALREAGLPADHFGTLARTVVPLTAGRWRVKTTSDDGVRVRVDDEIVLENWTWHGPAVDTGEFTVDTARPVTIQVEHFELDGYAILLFELEKI